MRNTPPIRSIDDAVTVLTLVATGRILSALIPRAWSSDILMTVNWAPVSVVALRPLACPALALLLSLGGFSFS